MNRRGDVDIAVVAFLVVAACGATAVCGNDPPADDEFWADGIDVGPINLGVSDAQESLVFELADRLSDPDPSSRQEATDALSALGPSAFKALALRYRESDSYEARLRIEEIVEDQYLWHTLFRKRGFLGISYPRDNAIAQLRDGKSGLVVQSVEPGTAAEAAGLRDRDIIIAVDGQLLGEDQAQPSFPDMIMEKGAGSQIRLTVVRGPDAPKTLEIDVTLGARPREHYLERDRPDMLADLNASLQRFSMWWARHFAAEAGWPRRTASPTVRELPD